MAAELVVKTNDLQCDVMSGLRYIRHWIVHSKCVADTDYVMISA